MSNFEKFCLSNGIPLKEVVTPLENLLLRFGIISKPIGMLSYTRRALWFSFIFTLLFLSAVELILRLIGISFFTLLTSSELFFSIFALLCSGPIAAFFYMKTMKKHRDVLITFWSEK